MTRTRAEEVAHIIRITDERGDFIHFEDGYLCFAPTGSPVWIAAMRRTKRRSTSTLPTIHRRPEPELWELR